MADTVKKSRIVSDDCLPDNATEDNSSLQDIINEEFNQRLKTCMKNDELESDIPVQTPPYETGEGLKNGHSKNHIDLIENFLPSEIPHEFLVLNTRTTEITKRNESFDLDNDENLGPETSPIHDSTSAKDRFLSTVTDVDDAQTDLDKCISSTAKDRLFLATDSACLLFTQTVVQSPMLTPTEENYDFMQGVQISPDDSSLQETCLPENDENVGQPYLDHFPSLKQTTQDFLEHERSFTSSHSPDPDIPSVQITQFTPETEDNPLIQQETESIQPNTQPETIESAKQPEMIQSHQQHMNESHEQKIMNQSHEQQETIESVGSQQMIESVESQQMIESVESQQMIESVESQQMIESVESQQMIESVEQPEVIGLSQKESIESFQTIESHQTIGSHQTIETHQTIESHQMIGSHQKETIESVRTETIESLQKEMIESLQKETIESVEQHETIEFVKQHETIESVTEKTELFESKRELVTDFSNGENFGGSVDDEDSAVDETDRDVGFVTVQKTKEMFERKASPVGDQDSCGFKSSNFVRYADTSPIRTSDGEIDFSNSPTNLSSSTTTESFIEATTETKSSQEKSLKKKKSKKAKKEHEKENISVSECSVTNEEDCLSHVSVRNLCRSFSDLTSIESAAKNDEAKILERGKAGRTKSLSDIRRDCKSYRNENVFSGVSVKQLRESFTKLINNNTNTSSATARPGALTGPHSPVKVGLSTRLDRLKSSFSKFDALQKKTVLHVRSTEASKAPEKFNGSTPTDVSNCKSCSKPVFQMEQIKAEKNIWHKNCFRCNECNKQLTVDTYQSNEGILYCKPHFKSLFAPKVVEEKDQPMRPRKHELIIRENQPEELPPDVVRASDKPDLGLEELQKLNVKERFQLFETQNQEQEGLERTSSAVCVKRSPSILSKLATFQKKGMDVGVKDDSLNGVPVEMSSSSEEEPEDEEGEDGEDVELVRAKRAQREKPLHFNNMSEVMSKWESGNQMSKEERREERKQEIQSIRSRLFMGKQAKIKEMYQQAVAESESGAHVKRQTPTELPSESARFLKERFERAQAEDAEARPHPEDEEMAAVLESAISRKSRSIFLELDATAAKAPPPLSPPAPKPRRQDDSPVARQQSSEVVRSSDQVDDVTIRTADITNRFKFFETYKEPEKHRKQFRITPPREGQVKVESPEREVYHDPEVVRSNDPADDPGVVQRSHTATKMLSIFRQMEEQQNREPQQLGPKPLKRFTPPPEPSRDESSSAAEDSATDDEDDEDVDDEEEEEDERAHDEDLMEARKAARAKQLRAKFERWEANEVKREQSTNAIHELADEQGQVESAKSLRARFESMRETKTTMDQRPKVKVNRFVDTTNNVETCKACRGRVYPLEKISCHNSVYHKNCFRCRECNAVLRMDSYAYNQGLLYCSPHFKRLFISKGNYESGFGLGQHKDKWSAVS